MFLKKNNARLRTGRIFLWGIVFSVIVHILVLSHRIEFFDETLLKDEKASNPIEITELPKNFFLEKDNKTKPETALPKKGLEPVKTEQINNNEVDPNAKFFSDKTQTVKEQKRADLFDTEKREGTGPKNQNKGPESISKTEAPKVENQNLSELEVADKGTTKPIQIKEWNELSLKDLGINGNGLSATSPDYLEDIAKGERTVLSTRELKYFSYYYRVKELLLQHWSPTVKEKIYKLFAKGAIIRKDELTTKVFVVLDSQGNTHKIATLVSCGFPTVDSAALIAFQKASPFPNPPKGMVEPDGFVRLQWDFTIQLVSAPRIEFQQIQRVPSHY